MLRSLVCDLSKVRGVELITSRDERLATLDFSPALDFERAMEEASAVWPIAPETSGVLERISRTILERGKILLGSAPETVRICASKLETHRVLTQANIAAVPTFKRDENLPDIQGWVVKPDDGAGCLNTRFFHSRDEALRVAKAHEFILQPFVRGDARSLSLICASGEARLLSCNRQRIEQRDGALHFLGCDTASFDDASGALSKLASQIASAFPGLWGYCGVDYIATESGVVVVDINPRLTTSYVGLSGKLGINVAALVLDHAVR